MMDKTLTNRIADELKEFLNREPTEDEIMNAQNDSIIMRKVERRIDTEEKGILADEIQGLKDNLAVISVIK